MWSEVFWMSRHKKDDGQIWRADQANENDFPLPGPHIQVGGDGEVNPPSNTFNISSFLTTVYGFVRHTLIMTER